MDELVCTTCGKTTPKDGAALLTWVRSTEHGRDVWTCDLCSREHLRSMESKLDSGWW